MLVAMTMESQATENLLALVALVISVIAAAYSWWVSRQQMKLERHVSARDDRVEKSTAYLQLEVHSSEAFRYAALNAEAMRPYEASTKPARLPKHDRQNAEIARQYYFQCLNLFEVCSNFRRNGVIDEAVYASWVAWFHEVLDQWYFRELWVTEMRENYTPDVRNLFDIGVQIYADHKDPDERRRQFYHAACHLLGGCKAVAGWLDGIEQVPEWPAKEHGTLVMVPRKAAKR
ncbi:DUF4760 domain-containing protein [Erythrobacter sp. EC-HK427]|uniref:DUF4760 domain-containing protein n=1 Tax=Erythrobacter sp. EC-HK427 TaxID=2038396 RepID=UPI001257041D|nr:hypothetical protein [Erythrobacter sp. EC-HK427]VVT17802.1 conserved hypothetical protein [Erythrobacter sp. EC-HK427]